MLPENAKKAMFSSAKSFGKFTQKERFWKKVLTNAFQYYIMYAHGKAIFWLLHFVYRFQSCIPTGNYYMR